MIPFEMSKAQATIRAGFITAIIRHFVPDCGRTLNNPDLASFGEASNRQRDLHANCTLLATHLRLEVSGIFSI